MLFEARSSSAQKTAEKEQAIARAMVADIDSRFAPLNDPGAAAMVNRIVASLSHGQLPRLSIQLKLIEERNTIASPMLEGWILLSSGAILSSESEARLAGLVAHAMGHVQAGQPNRLSQSSGKIPLVWSWQCVRWPIGGPNRILLPGDQDALFDLTEAQADLLGLGYLVSGGFDPEAIVSPDPGVKAKAAALAAIAPGVWNTSEFDQVRARLTPPAPSLRKTPSLNR